MQLYYSSNNNVPKLGTDGFYHYLYQTTNTVNNYFYIGVHSQDPNKNDNYLGSGKGLLREFKKTGKEIFVKTIIEYFDNHEEAKLREAEIVTAELTNRSDCYNLVNGGGCLKGGVGTVSVKDTNGNMLKVKKDDPRYLSGELVGVTKGRIFTADERLKRSSEIKGRSHSDQTKQKMAAKVVGTVAVKHSVTGERMRLAKTDPRYRSGEYVGVTKGNPVSEATKQKIKDTKALKQYEYTDEYKESQRKKQLGNVIVFDKSTDKYITVSKTDPRYLSGELKHKFANGLDLSLEAKAKISESKKGKVAVRSTLTNECMLVDKDDPRYLSGELVGVNTGMVIVYDKDGKRFKVHKTDARLLSGEVSRTKW